MNENKTKFATESWTAPIGRLEGSHDRVIMVWSHSPLVGGFQKEHPHFNNKTQISSDGMGRHNAWTGPGINTLWQVALETDILK